jgi:lipoprotein NlpI
LELGITYNILGLSGEALKALKKAVVIDPRFAQANYSLGLCYLWNGDQALPWEEYQILRGLDPDLAGQFIQVVNRY